MSRIQKITRAYDPAARPSRWSLIMDALVRPIQKAFSLLSRHSAWGFIGTSSHWGARAYQQLAQSAMTNAVAYRSYRLISDTMSSIRLFAATEESAEVAKRQKSLHGETTLVKVPDHPFVEVLRRPNKEEPSYQNFIMRIVADLFFGGEVFFYTPGSALTGPNAGLPTELGIFTIRPDRFTRFERNSEGIIVRYHWNGPDGKTRKTDAARIEHIKMPDPRRSVNNTVGFSTNLDAEERGFPIAAAIWQELQLVEAGNDWNHSVFKNRGRVPGFFKYLGKGKFTDAQFKRTKEGIQEAYAADTEASLPGLLEGDYDFLENNISQRDADWLRGVQQYMKWICVALGIDPALVGDQGSRTLANLSIAVRSLYTLTVLPLLDWIVDEWNARYMVKYDGDARLFVDREGIDALQEDRTLVVERAVRAAGVPIATREEARTMAGLDAEAEGTFFVPTSVVEEGSAHEDEETTSLLDLSGDEIFAYVKTLMKNGEETP